MLHSLVRKQLLQTDLHTLWAFISSPKNLAQITPSYMGFEVLSNPDDLTRMYPGQLIEYYVKPLWGIKVHWVTEITHVKDNEFFVDEQRFGPYAFWHHKHYLREVPGGVEMTDTVHYKLPMGSVGRFANAIFVKKKINEIFDFRYKRLNELFCVR